MKTEVQRTFKNWRWWAALPIMLPTAIFVYLVLYPLHKILWPVGQAICRFSNWCYFRETPDWLRAIHIWVFEHQ